MRRPSVELKSETEPAPSRHTRREFLTLGVGVLGTAAIGSACGGSSGTSTPGQATTADYLSRPDLKPVLIDVTRGTGTPGSGYVCVTPQGAMLVDNAGEPVWVRSVPHAATNLRVQSLNGRPVLTWWEGEVTHYGVGQKGHYVIVDGSYQEVMRVYAHNGLSADLHEFLITPDGIAYFTAYHEYTTDLTSVGGPKKGRALDSTIQGVDLATGKLVFDWHSADHIDFTESYAKYPPSSGFPYDPVHLNSVDTTPDGKLLFSARNTWTLYKVDPLSGDIVWRLAGKKSDFKLGKGVRFAWQHDAQSQPDGTITVFDDEGDPPEAKQSRGLILNVNETAKTVALAKAYLHPHKALLAGYQGSVQPLPEGNVLVGWGSTPYYTEFTADGSMVLDAKFATGASYRVYRFDWTGTPTEAPVVAVGRTSGGGREVHASWNGSTETAAWQLLAGPSPQTLSVVGEVQRQGFETVLPLRGNARHVAVRSLDTNGHTLAQSRTIVA